MANSSPVGGPGGASPYTNETTSPAERTGQTNDHRKVTVHPGQSHIPEIPEDIDTAKPISLTKRKVAPHTGSNKLKPMPGSDDGFKPLGEKGRPSDNGAIPSASTQQTNPQEGQEAPADSANPKVTVESTESLAPLPPLTPEQQKQKATIIGALKAVVSFVKNHKNTLAMGGGTALMIVGLTMMTFPPTAVIGIFPVMFGYTALTMGFSFAMMNNADSGEQTPPPVQPESESQGKKKNDESAGGSESPSPNNPGGHFAKIDHVTGSPEEAVAELQEAEETSAEAMAKKGEMLNLQNHLEQDLRAAFQEHAAAKASSETEITEAAMTGSQLEEKLLDIAAEYAVRAGLTADDGVVTSIVESGKIIASALDEKEGMSQEERQSKFQELFVSQATDPRIPDEAIKLLHGALDRLVENDGRHFNAAVKTALESTSAFLKVILDSRSALDGTVEGISSDESSSHRFHQAIKATADSTYNLLKTITDHPQKVPAPFNNAPGSEPAAASGNSPVSLIELETMLNPDSVHDPDKDLQNIHHLRQLSDAIEAQGRKDSMADRDVEQMKKKLLNCCLDLLNTSMSTRDFRAALVEKVDPVSMAEDRRFLDRALTAHQWFKGH